MNRHLIIETRSARRDASGEPVIEVGRTRLIVIGALFSIVFSVIGLRLFDLAVLTQRDTTDMARIDNGHTALPARADITDRNGVALATSLVTASLYADTTQIRNGASVARRVARVLPELDAKELAAKLSTRRGFVWLKRHLTPREQHGINRLGIPALDFRYEGRRVYPMAETAAHVVGFTDIDNRGLAGIERQFERQLHSGETPLATSLDIRVQHVLRQELQHAMDRFKAIGAAGVVMDVDTGEVIAMVSLPDFNPNHPMAIDATARFNRNTLGVYEMGSTFKIFTTAMALDSGAVTMSDGFDATDPIRVARYVIRDFHAKRRWLSVPEIFMYSSNIGAVKMGLAVGQVRQRDYLRRLGMFDPSPIELPEIGRPLLPEVWRDVSTMTVSFGHGLSVTPLHVASGVAAIVNGGIFHAPTIVRQDGPVEPGRRVISSGTSDKLRRLMRLVVKTGTGRKAGVAGYLVGGKTGTAEKVSGKSYKHRALLSSFVGAFPMTAPRYVVLAIVDEPQPRKDTHGYATGGWVAAPVVGAVVKRIGPLLGIRPVNEDSPDVRERMYLAIDKRDGGTRLASY